MEIIISGYGRMGKEVNSICKLRNHKVIAIVDKPEDWNKITTIDTAKAVVIDFSIPGTAIDVYNTCLKNDLSIVTGTTGWYDNIDKVKSECEINNGSFLYSPNFSIGVNLFFKTNEYLAKLMSRINNYDVCINEVHHIHKLDEPSGTAINTANQIINNSLKYKSWNLNEKISNTDIPIYSFREGEITGQHEVVWDSEEDIIEIAHEAKSRKGFALGAVIAAEFLSDKKGFFTMDDMLKEIL